MRQGVCDIFRYIEALSTVKLCISSPYKLPDSHGFALSDVSNDNSIGHVFTNETLLAYLANKPPGSLSTQLRVERIRCLPAPFEACLRP